MCDLDDQIHRELMCCCFSILVLISSFSGLPSTPSTMAFPAQAQRPETLSASSFFGWDPCLRFGFLFIRFDIYSLSRLTLCLVRVWPSSAGPLLERTASDLVSNL